MRKVISLLLCAAPLFLGHPASAQTPAAPPAEQMQQMMDAAKRMMNPAAFALAHRSALGLTEDQVSAIEPLADRMEDVVEQHVARQASTAGGSVVARALQDPTLELDEAAIRAEACEQATRQAELSIEMIRTHRGMARVLTSTQQQELMRLQTTMGLRMMQDPSGTPPRP